MSLDSACEIAKDSGWRTERRAINQVRGATARSLRSGVPGTLVPIRSITTDDVSPFSGESGGPGPCCAKILLILKGIRQGKLKDRFH